MSTSENFARFRRLVAEDAAWRLLRSEHAPMVLAFVADLFEERAEVPFGEARSALEAELALAREQGQWEGEEGAGGYLRRWIQAGWLRELDDQLAMTDACGVALRFCHGLDRRDSHSTASHLRVVQDAVRDLAAALSPSADARIALLENQRAALERELEDLRAGVVRQLSEVQQRERVREVYQLASMLTADFRRFEERTRQHDHATRVQMIEASENRGEVLTGLLGRESLLAGSDPGRAFQGFFELLMDENRSTELREQLQSILARPAARHLADAERRFLGRLMRELGRESESVLKVRRRTEAGLRAFIESGAMNESRAVERLLGQLERSAVALRDAGVSPLAATRFTVPSGAVRITTADRFRPRLPEEQIDLRGVAAVPNAHTPSDAVLEQLHAVRLREVARAMRARLHRHGPSTIGGLLERAPIESGLEELVAHLRVARAVGATEMEGRERVLVTDRRREPLRASIPRLLLHAELFPQSVEELAL